MLTMAGLRHNKAQDDEVRWKKGLRRKINYAFRVVVCMIHYLLAYLEYAAGDVDSDDTSHTDDTTSTYGSFTSAASDGSATDDTVNYHDVRQQDRFFYAHAALLSLSLLFEVAASFLCKKKDRSSSARRWSFAPSPRPSNAPLPIAESTLQHENPLHSSDSNEDNEKL